MKKCNCQPIPAIQLLWTSNIVMLRSHQKRGQFFAGVDPKVNMQKRMVANDANPSADGDLRKPISRAAPPLVNLTAALMELEEEVIQT